MMVHRFELEIYVPRGDDTLTNEPAFKLLAMHHMAWRGTGREGDERIVFWSTRTDTIFRLRDEGRQDEAWAIPGRTDVRDGLPVHRFALDVWVGGGQQEWDVLNAHSVIALLAAEGMDWREVSPHPGQSGLLFQSSRTDARFRIRDLGQARTQDFREDLRRARVAAAS